MNRFTIKGEQRFLSIPRIRLFYLICPLLLILFWISLSSISETTVDRQYDSLEAALNRNIIHCYAVEGFYPPSLAYIEEHYGLTYNKELFFIDYQPIGSNLQPNITILIR